jgi:hypothetical protein
MKLTRRSFIQIGSIATAWFLSPFKKLVAREKAISLTIIAPHRSCCYIYNPGLDIEGVRSHVFGQLNIIKGGEITRIEHGEERLITKPNFEYRVHEDTHDFEKEWTEQGLYRVEQVAGVRIPSIKEEDRTTKAWNLKDGNWFLEDLMLETSSRGEMVYLENHHIIVHPAQEIIESIGHSFNPRGYRLLAHIKEWDDKIVDIEGINSLLRATTLKDRIRNLDILPTAAWRMTSVLRKYLYPVLHSYESFANNELNERILRFKDGRMIHLDGYTRNLQILLNRKIDLKTIELPSIILPDDLGKIIQAIIKSS